MGKRFLCAASCLIPYTLSMPNPFKYDQTSEFGFKTDAYSRRVFFDEHSTFRVLQLSDLWNDGDKHRLNATVELVQSLLEKERPDFVVITGDTVAPGMEQQYE